MKVTKNIMLIVLSLVFFYALFFKSIYFIHFKINQYQIAKQFCENKDKPALKCNGKCHLTKELKKVDDPYNDSNFPFNRLKDKKEEVYFNEDIFKLKYSVTIHSKNQYFYIDNYDFKNISKLFKPPIV